MGDFAKRTLDRRASRIPVMLEARKQGKIAFLVMVQLITYDKRGRPPRTETNSEGVSKPKTSKAKTSKTKTPEYFSEESFVFVFFPTVHLSCEYGMSEKC